MIAGTTTNGLSRKKPSNKPTSIPGIATNNLHDGGYPWWSMPTVALIMENANAIAKIFLSFGFIIALRSRQVC
jgi:hypothetical protein